jgi:bifunctional non-homologous end joining protein LigD
MSLERYRKKRNFKKTPEPSGNGHTNGNGKLHFVIQKHDASHLHYDFRLENKGTLKSWAVPKGPSTDPSTKRLAMEVEDHPISYGDFEGTIPAGNYGAGTVIVWDNGEYFVDPNKSKEENDKLIAEAIKEGNLKFTLDGKKLKGKYALVRLKDKPGSKGKHAWLLIKKEDEFAGQPIKSEDSVKTGRSLNEVAEGVPAKKKSAKKTKKVSAIDLSDAPKEAMPKNLSPMLATLTEEAFDRDGWIYEVKWDGYRVLAEIHKGDVRLYSRNDNTLNEQFEVLVKDLENLNADVLLDGEVVVVDDQGVSRFQLLQNYMREPGGRLMYYVFDILHYNGHDLRSLPQIRRKEILTKVITPTDFVKISDHIETKGKEFFKAAKKHGLEGIIAKNASARYQTGTRSRDWLKIKSVMQQEAIICGFTEPRGSRKHMGALILGVYKNKELTYAGHTGGGFTHDLLKETKERLTPYIIKDCPFKHKPRTNAPVTWLKPSLLCEVKFQEWTDDGHMRQPIFLGLREDKKPVEVKEEKPEPVKEVLKKTKTVPIAKAAAKLPDTKVKISNPDKVYWPDEGYTKKDLVDYYQEIADVILPYLKDRPQSLHRHPNGIKEKGFFHKNMDENLPSWIKTCKVESDTDGSITRYMLCQDRDALAYMNNLGCIEINHWMSTVHKLRYPDIMVFDFDPLDIGFNKVIEVALATRKLLESIGIESFCKTSGKTGLHINIPMGTKYTFDQVQNFAQALCQLVHEQMPDITSLERSPARRKKKVYLDYLQNHYTATMAAVYSVRPHPGATVSAPLLWSEVNSKLDPSKFTIKTMPKRIDAKGDLWKGVLGKGIDMAKCIAALEKKYYNATPQRRTK